jgi:hypothetical protein
MLGKDHHLYSQNEYVSNGEWKRVNVNVSLIDKERLQRKGDNKKRIVRMEQIKET